MKYVEGRVRIGEEDGVESSKRDGGTEVEAGPTSGKTDTMERGRFASLDSFLEELGAIADTHDVIVQAFDARYIAGRDHLESAVEHAQRAIERGENVADSPAVEILLYAAGRRQIDRAMEMGVGTGDRAVVIIVVGDAEAEADAIESLRERIQPGTVEPDADRLETFFEITEAERRATEADLEALVLERVALLDVEK